MPSAARGEASLATPDDERRDARGATHTPGCGGSNGFHQKIHGCVSLHHSYDARFRAGQDLRFVLFRYSVRTTAAPASDALTTRSVPRTIADSAMTR
jgi:hypothetical protein